VHQRGDLAVEDKVLRLGIFVCIILGSIWLGVFIWRIIQ